MKKITGRNVWLTMKELVFLEEFFDTMDIQFFCPGVKGIECTESCGDCEIYKKWKRTLDRIKEKIDTYASHGRIKENISGGQRIAWVKRKVELELLKGKTVA